MTSLRINNQKKNFRKTEKANITELKNEESDTLF